MDNAEILGFQIKFIVAFGFMGILALALLACLVALARFALTIIKNKRVINRASLSSTVTKASPREHNEIQSKRSAAYTEIRVAKDDAHGVLVAACVFLALAGLLSTALIPYEAKYLQQFAVEGQVESVSNRLESGSGDVTQREYVVEVSTLDRPVTFDDPRILSYEGDTVTMTCQVKWVFRGADRYSCTIADR